jgi:hypothetical protein
VNAVSRSPLILLVAFLLFAGVLVMPRTARAGQGGSPQADAARQRPVPFEVLKKYQDGPWLVPTLESVRSPNDWDQLMVQWFARQEVAGIQPAPAIDWSHKAIVVIALGTQPGRCGVNVLDCLVEADSTVLDLFLELGGDQWDPEYEHMHPAVLVAIEREDLNNLKLKYNGHIEGLPGSAGKRTGRIRPVPSTTATDAQAPAMSAADVATTGIEASNAGLEGEGGSTTWGRVKAHYRGPLTR